VALGAFDGVAVDRPATALDDEHAVLLGVPHGVADELRSGRAGDDDPG
jgi:hypothetical protein